MSEPFIYIASYQVRPGKLEQARRRLREVVQLVGEQEPQVEAFHFFVDEPRERIMGLQVHPDSESMARHMAVVAEHLTSAWEWLDPSDMDTTVLGTPPDALVRYAREFDQTLHTYPTHVAGFTRSGAANLGV